MAFWNLSLSGSITWPCRASPRSAHSTVRPLALNIQTMNNVARRVICSMATGAFSAFVGLAGVLLGGVAAWTVFRGIPGIIIAMILGGVTAVAIRRFKSWPASTIAGAVGAMVAAYLAIACAEVFEPGSYDWALKGGMYGGMIGIPLGGLLGLLGLPKRIP